MIAWPRSIRCWPPRPLRGLLARLAGVSRLVDRKNASRIRIIGRWVAPDGVVHARGLWMGKHRGLYTRGLRTLCMKPWKHPPTGEQCPEGLCRADFMGLAFSLAWPITCERCEVEITKCCGMPPLEVTNQDDSPPGFPALAI